MKTLLLKIGPRGSLVLLIAVLSLWLRSCWRWDDCTVYKHGTSVEFLSGMRCIYFEVVTHDQPSALFSHESFAVVDDDDWGFLHARVQNEAFALDHENMAFWHNFGFIRGNYFLLTESPPFWKSGPMVAVQAPDWSIALLLSVLPAFELRRMLRNRRRRLRGLCAACGYDLRASPGRCLECGHLSKIAA